MKKTFIAGLSLALFFLISPFQMVQNIWIRCVLKQPVSIFDSVIQKAYAVVLSTVEEALRVFMPDADQYDEKIYELTAEQIHTVEENARIRLADPHRRFYFYEGIKDGKVIGYAGADTVPGKWGPIHYMLAISLDGKIKDVMVIEYQEKRGKPVAKKRFLKQFFGKTSANDLDLAKDIRGVSGASISSRGMTDGIRKMIHVFEVFYAGK